MQAKIIHPDDHKKLPMFFKEMGRNMMVAFVVMLMALGGAVLPAYQVAAQDYRADYGADYGDVNNRLKQIDNQIQTLSQAVFKGGIIQPKTAQDYQAQNIQFNNQNLAQNGAGLNPAEIEVRLSQLEREIRGLTGRIETQAHNLAKIQDQMNRRLTDIELRMQDIEGGNNTQFGGINAQPQSAGQIGAPQIATPLNTQTLNGQSLNGQSINNVGLDKQRYNNQGLNNQSLGTVPAAGNTGSINSAAPGARAGLAAGTNAGAGLANLPINDYETAFAQLKQGQYDTAEKQFRDFISQNPDHRLVSNARYWLGETYYVRKDYEQAARAFARGYKENPSGAKAPDNLLKLGLSLDGLGNRDDACVALIQLTQKFPEGPRPVLNRAEQEIARLRCSR